MIFRFGPYEVDEQRGELRRAGRPVEIQPKPLALLALLIRERHRVVSQDELFEALWPGTAVTSSSLTRAVSHARRAIDDTHKGALVRSVPRRGYRFMGEVAELAGPGASRTSAAPGEPATRPRAETVGAARGVGRSVDDVFVGRTDALERLRVAWDDARGGLGRLLLVCGAAGIGKTRLVEAFAREATDAGALVVVGRCREGEGVPAFWLWSQVLSALVEADLVGAPSDWEGLLSRSLEAPDPERRFRFFESVTRELVDASRKRPLILVLEDLQWAQPTSLRLLEHLSYEVADAPVLVIATIRNEVRTIRNEAREREDALGRVLPVLRRHAGSEQIDLQGLSRGDVGRLLQEVIGRPAPAELTSELYARTEGVPLFVRELVRLLGERGDLKRPERIRRTGITLPEHAMDLIHRSLDGLSTACAEIVAACAVLGREFALPVVAEVAQMPRADVLDRLDEAVAAGVLEEIRDAPARYRFTHALFQETAYAALSAGRRARLHDRAARSLADRSAGRPALVIAERSHHHHQSLAVGDPEEAFQVAMAAAEEASRVFAYEQAALHFEQAVHALDHMDGVDGARRLPVLIEGAEAHRRAGDRERRRAVAMRAIETARSLGRPHDLAQAAVRFCDLNEWSPEDREAEAAVEEALSVVDGEQTALRARLLARRAYLGIRHPSARQTAREAVRIGRASGEPATLQEVLYVLHYALAGPDHLAERWEMADELYAAALASRSHDTAVIALLDLACDRLTLGDPDGATQMRRAVDTLVGDAPSPSVRWHTSVFDTGVALMQGRMAGVEQAMADALLLGRRSAHPYAQACFNGQQMQIDRYRGRYEAIRPVFSRAMSSAIGPNHWATAVMVRNELRLENEDRARAIWEGLAASDFSDIQRGIRWIATMVEIAHACVEIGDAVRARVLLESLAAAADLHGVMPIPIMYSGPTSYALARLNELLGIVDAAADEYEHALEASARLGALPVRARIQKDYARLLEHGGEGARARDLLAEAESWVRETGCAL